MRHVARSLHTVEHPATGRTNRRVLVRRTCDSVWRTGHPVRMRNGWGWGGLRACVLSGRVPVGLFLRGEGARLWFILEIEEE